jgi:pilus assembly protein Flp/PilA
MCKKYQLPKAPPMLSRLIRLNAMFRNSESGATAVEYGLMVALIAIVIIVAVSLLGTNLSTLFNTVATSV